MVYSPHLMMIELNEFNPAYLQEMSIRLKLSNLQRRVFLSTLYDRD